MAANNFTYCNQPHQIDLCKDCTRNFKQFTKASDLAKLTFHMFEPNLTPTQSCYGFTIRKNNA